MNEYQMNTLSSDASSVFFPPLTTIYIFVVSYCISYEPFFFFFFLENKVGIFLHFNTKGATDKI